MVDHYQGTHVDLATLTTTNITLTSKCKFSPHVRYLLTSLSKSIWADTLPSLIYKRIQIKLRENFSLTPGRAHLTLWAAPPPSPIPSHDSRSWFGTALRWILRKMLKLLVQIL